MGCNGREDQEIESRARSQEIARASRRFLAERRWILPSSTGCGRAERRIPAAIAVEIIGLHADIPEMAFTNNVSPHGARVLAKHKGHAREIVRIRSVPGDFNSRARVVYCHALPNRQEYVLGLTFLDPSGEWFLNPARVPED
jgi:hypothetical protein